MSPTGFEPVTPSLKVRCSKTNWATKTLSKWQGSNLRPERPKRPALPTELHLDIVEERAGFEPAEPWSPPVFKTGAINQLYHLSLYCCLGWTRTNTPGAKIRCPAFRLRDNLWNHYVKEPFWAPYQIRTDFSWLQVRRIANNAYRANIKQKTRDFYVSGFTFLLLC